MDSTLLFKKAVYQQIARIGKAVASASRLELLDLLSQGPRTVEVLAKEANLSVANASQHLQILRAARLVEAEKEGQLVTYRSAQGVHDFLPALLELAENRLAEVQQVVRQYFEEPDVLEQIDFALLLTRVRAGEVTLLDVRPPEEYRAGHLAGAISIPVTELTNRLAELPKDRQIVAYCRGPYCILALQAVEILKKFGFKGVRVKEGVPEWRARGLPVVSGERSW